MCAKSLGSLIEVQSLTLIRGGELTFEELLEGARNEPRSAAECFPVVFDSRNRVLK